MPVVCAAGAGGAQHLQAREVLLPGAGLLQPGCVCVCVCVCAKLDQAPGAEPPRLVSAPHHGGRPEALGAMGREGCCIRDHASPLSG